MLAAEVRGDVVVTMERRTGEQQASLVVRSATAADAPPLVLVDPAAGAADAAVAIDWFFVSPDGSLVAYGVSEGGTESSVLRVIRTADASDVGDEIPNTRACTVGWEPDGSGFVYTRYPEGDEYHRTVHTHRLGADWRDDPVLWAEHPTPETWPDVKVSADGRHVLVQSMVGWSRYDQHLLDRTTGEWTDLIVGVEAISRFEFGDGRLAVRSDHPRRAAGSGRADRARCGAGRPGRLGDDRRRAVRRPRWADGRRRFAAPRHEHERRRHHRAAVARRRAARRVRRSRHRFGRRPDGRPGDRDGVRDHVRVRFAGHAVASRTADRRTLATRSTVGRRVAADDRATRRVPVSRRDDDRAVPGPSQRRDPRAGSSGDPHRLRRVRDRRDTGVVSNGRGVVRDRRHVRDRRAARRVRARRGMASRRPARQQAERVRRLRGGGRLDGVDGHRRAATGWRSSAVRTVGSSSVRRSRSVPISAGPCGVRCRCST